MKLIRSLKGKSSKKWIQTPRTKPLCCPLTHYLMIVTKVKLYTKIYFFSFFDMKFNSSKIFFSLF